MWEKSEYGKVHELTNRLGIKRVPGQRSDFDWYYCHPGSTTDASQGGPAV